MTYQDLETVRMEAGLGVNRFLRLTGLPKSTYYRQQKARLPARARSDGPHGHVQEGVLEDVRRLCHEHPRLGHRPIHALLTESGRVGSASSVLRVMRREKLLQPRRKGRLRPAPPPAVPAHVGLTIGLDFTWWLGKPVLNVLEYESRYCLASVVCERENAMNAREGLRLALLEARRLGLNAQGVEVKSDHGSAFTAGKFREFLTQWSCGQTLSAVGRPQGMGRVERFNRSVKEQALVWEDISDGRELQSALDSYRRYYNEVRPHGALGYRTPLGFIQLKTAKVVPSN